ncbi:S-2-hydroxy-acid oxidase [Nymphaea thermarum]|nr:S-2-hydroxy-acid oxidase [Nymphaea thermarum]
MVVSTFSSIPHEEIAADCNGTLFLQLYVFKNREITTRLVQKAEKCGYKALVLTADVPKLGRREADIRNGLVPIVPMHFRSLLTEDVVHASGSKAEAFASHVLDASLCWKDMEWLRSITTLPVFIKGLLTAEDAEKALEVGVDGIIVSNHGGRQLDCAPAAISALEEVVKAVAGKVPVLLDGGIRRGTDVFKALALGAQAILIGRSVVFGLAAKGEEGVRKVIEILKSELELSMALNGCCSTEGITRAHVQTLGDRLRSML